MAGDDSARDKMVKGAAQLLARRGLHATSFTEVLAATGAPRGSIYHHFPNGKDQLVHAALELAAAQMAHYLEPKSGAPADEITDAFLRIWRAILTRSDFQAGCAVVAVTVATDSPALLAEVAAIFRSWREQLAGMLERGGLSAPAATRFAALLVAASEGAVVIARAEQSIEPFELVAAQLTEQVRALLKR